MAVLKVVKFPDPVLATRAKEVEVITEEDRRLARDMIDTMYAENGVGLAANQVGSLRRLFVASPDQERGKEMVFFNPEILSCEGQLREFEGCLSVPEYYEPVRRARRVVLRAMNLRGETVEVQAEGLLSRIFQHEIDHLNGTLFIDRLGFLKSRRIKKKLSKRSGA